MHLSYLIASEVIFTLTNICVALGVICIYPPNLDPTLRHENGHAPASPSLLEEAHEAHHHLKVILEIPQNNFAINANCHLLMDQ